MHFLRSSRLPALTLLSALLLMGKANAAPLTFEPLTSEQQCPGFSFQLDGNWSRSSFLPSMFYLDPDKNGSSPISITGLPGYDPVGHWSNNSQKNAERFLRTLQSSSNKNKNSTLQIVNLKGTYGVAEIRERDLSVWVYEGNKSLTIHYKDGQSDKPDIAKDVLAQMCQTFVWKRQPTH